MVDPPHSRNLLRGLTIAAFGAALAYLFFGEHRVHLLGYLPCLLILMCPLLHMTMHGGHGGEPPARPGGAPHQHPR